MNRLTFALPSGYDWELSTFVKAVKTKKWVTQHKNNLYNYGSRFTTSGNDHSVTVKMILTAAYGVNIGEQIFSKLKITDIDKIKTNVLSVIYK